MVHVLIIKFSSQENMFSKLLFMTTICFLMLVWFLPEVFKWRTNKSFWTEPFFNFCSWKWEKDFLKGYFKIIRFRLNITISFITFKNCERYHHYWVTRQLLCCLIFFPISKILVIKTCDGIKNNKQSQILVYTYNIPCSWRIFLFQVKSSLDHIIPIAC